MKFWHDLWCGETSLAVSYPELFRVCQDKEVSVVELMKLDNGVLFWDVSFFRVVHARELEALAGFMDTIYGVSVRIRCAGNLIERRASWLKTIIVS